MPCDRAHVNQGVAISTVLVRVGCKFRAVSGGLRWGAVLLYVCLDIVSLQTCSFSQTVAGCRLGGYPVGRYQWGGDRVVGGVLPRIDMP